MDTAVVLMVLVPGLILALSSSPTSAQCGAFKFAKSYGSSMVLQRSPAKAVVWGYAAGSGVQVTVTIGANNQQVMSTIGPAGSPIWRVELLPQNAGGPFTISATSGLCTITLSDVMFGDVYVCAGQSNMQFRMNEIDNYTPDVVDSVNYPDVRTFRTSLIQSAVPLYDVTGVDQTWARPDGGSNIASFSALCWLFGRRVNAYSKVPIGLIQSAWGGTRIEAWMSTAALEVCWPGNTVPAGDGYDGRPSNIWNAMIHPFLDHAIFGAIWYQGESNFYNAGDYDCAIKAMVGDWRSNWRATTGQTDPLFPFGQVQLAPWRLGEIVVGFPDVRWSQTYNLGYTPNDQLRRIYTAVAVDLPDVHSPSGSIHPRYKRPIAERLFYGVLHVGYNDTSQGPFQGPRPTSAHVTSSAVTLTYDNGDAVIEQRGTSGFEVCCAARPADRCPTAGTWTAAAVTATACSTVDLVNPCSGSTVVTGMRYLWRETPCLLEMCAIYGVDNKLPAPPYMMDI